MSDIPVPSHEKLEMAMSQKLVWATVLGGKKFFEIC